MGGLDELTGFQSLSKIMHVSAAVRLIPTPPFKRIEKRREKILFRVEVVGMCHSGFFGVLKTQPLTSSRTQKHHERWGFRLGVLEAIDCCLPFLASD